MQEASNRIAVVVHGGAGGPSENDDGCQVAAQRAVEQLKQGNDALAAAVAAVVALEDDGRFNAGSGAALGLDGTTIELDACVMDTRGRLGTVACLKNVKNPILVARAIADSPHLQLAAEGAERFARLMGHPEHPGPTAKARKEHDEMIAQLNTCEQGTPGIDNAEYAKFWNYATAVPFTAPQCDAANQGAGMVIPDTVGAVVRDAEGNFAVAGSTGGSAPSLLGRVGDTPIMGSGFYAGPHGAVAATGIGEAIVRRMLAYTVYQWIAEGVPLQQALQRGIDFFPKEVVVGLIAVSRTEAGHCCNQDMPTAKVSNE